MLLPGMLSLADQNRGTSTQRRAQAANIQGVSREGAILFTQALDCPEPKLTGGLFVGGAHRSWVLNARFQRRGEMDHERRDCKGAV